MSKIGPGSAGRFTTVLQLFFLLVFPAAIATTWSNSTNYGQKASQPLTLTVTKTHVVMDNGRVKVTLTNPSGSVAGIEYNGIDNVLEYTKKETDRGEWDIVWSSKNVHSRFDLLFATNFKIIVADQNQIEVSFVKYFNSHDQGSVPLVVDKRYVMLPRMSGFYTYAIFDHPRGWPDLDICEARIAFNLRKSLFSYMAISDDIQREMPTAEDRKNGETLAFREAALLTNPLNPSLKGEVFLSDHYAGSGFSVSIRNGERWKKGYQFWTKTNDKGYFKILAVRAGFYNLYAWIPGILGDFKYNKNIYLKPGDNIDVSNLIFYPPRNGPTLWEIGIPDRKASEFFVPDPKPGLANRLFTNNKDNKYVLQAGRSGFYTYTIFDHPQGWPDLKIDQARISLNLKARMFNFMAISDHIQRRMPTAADRVYGSQPLAYKEAVLLTHPSNPTFKGEVDDKYQYSLESKDTNVHGWICPKPHIGFWVITGSSEFRSGGPIKQDLTSHVGPVALSMFFSNHYAGKIHSVSLRNGEAWKKGYQFWTQTNKTGYFKIRAVRPGNYNLYAWVPGFLGDYKYNISINITPGDNINVRNLVFYPPRNGPTLWEIGIPDRKASEFFVPDPKPGLVNRVFITAEK
nr:probable rhamnogalacturonate lyase B [Ipomoea batatas]